MSDLVKDGPLRSPIKFLYFALSTINAYTFIRDNIQPPHVAVSRDV